MPTTDHTHTSTDSPLRRDHELPQALDASQHQGYALFDLDQTLIPWDTQLLFCDFVLKRMPLRRLYLLVFVPLLPFAKIIGTQGMKRVFLNYLWRMDQQQLDDLAHQFVEQHLPETFYKEMLEIVEQQKQLGRTTVLSSASPEIWVKPIAKKLGFDHYFATTVETAPHVRFMPKIIGGNNKGANKLHKMRDILPEGFDPTSGTTLTNSHGFSDSHADLPMLNICEHVTMVHPTEKLYQEGHPKGWNTLTPPRPTSDKKEFAIACLKQALGWY
jgi:HAD superfamily hydrolase (TIGR01490 family)